MIFDTWEWLLVVVVSIQATCMAYLHEPRWKAFMLTLPIPFSIAVMAVGRPIDASNVVALFLLYAFTAATRILHYNCRLPIVVAIVLSAVFYVTLGSVLAPVIPSSDEVFLAMAAAAFLFALWLFRHVQPRYEAGHRSPLPLYIKLPIVIGVVVALVLAKSLLQGLMTAFPMVGVVGAYEARKSLYTIADQIPTVILVLLPLMLASHFTHGSLGLGGSLLLGWAACASPLVLEWRAAREAMVRGCPSESSGA